MPIALPLQVIGLGLDVIGAFVIVSPDIPYLNRKFRTGRLREGRALLESAFLHDGARGFDDMIQELESIYDQQISPRPNVIQVDTREDWDNIYGHYAEEKDDSSKGEVLVDMPYQGFQLHLRREIQRGESRIRAVGFWLLALGFVIQIIGLL